MTRNSSHLHRQVLRGLVILAAGLTLSGTPAAQTPAPSWPIAEAPGELRAVVPRAAADRRLDARCSAARVDRCADARRSRLGDCLLSSRRNVREPADRQGSGHCRRANERSPAQPDQRSAPVGSSSCQGQRRASGEERRRLRSKRYRRSRRGAPSDCRAADVRGVPRPGGQIEPRCARRPHGSLSPRSAVGFRDGEIRGWFWVEMPKHR